MVPTKLVLTAPASATAGEPITVSIAALDDSGNLAGNFNGTVMLTGTAGGVTPTTVALSGGLAALQLTLTAAGLQIISVLFPGLAPAIDPITVAPDDFAQFLVSDPVTTAGTNFLVQVQAADRFGNPLTTYSGPPTATLSISPATTASNFPLTVSVGSSGLAATSLNTIKRPSGVA